MMEKCDNSLERIAVSIRSFAEKRTSFPSGSGLKFFESFEKVWQGLSGVMGNASDSKMSAVIAACRALSSVASKSCRKEEIAALKHVMDQKNKIFTNDVVEIDDDDIIEIDDDDDDDDDDIIEIAPQKSSSLQHQSSEVSYQDEGEEQGCVVM